MKTYFIPPIRELPQEAENILISGKIIVGWEWTAIIGQDKPV